MKALLKKKKEQRADIFKIAAWEMGISPTVVEKDFWVCVVLDYLFQKSRFKERFIFKGGTSLSKCYDAIKRFSEDIDLVIKWDSLGFADEEVYQNRSITQTGLFERRMNDAAAFFIEKELKKDLDENLLPQMGCLRFLDSPDPLVLLVGYETLFPDPYLTGAVKLEMGAVAAKGPAILRKIKPYYNQFVNLPYDDEEIEVLAVSIARTFWEKVLILYAESNRPEGKMMPQRYSRHYYDVSMIHRSSHFESILKKPELFEEVRRFKSRYYRAAWSRLEEADLATITLLPNAMRIEELRKDYESMKIMLFGEKPSFGEIVDELRYLEEELHVLNNNGKPLSLNE